jgi:hypothetical protein
MNSKEAYMAKPTKLGATWAITMGSLTITAASTLLGTLPFSGGSGGGGEGFLGDSACNPNGDRGFDVKRGGG